MHKFSRRQIGYIFLTFLTFHANCLLWRRQFAWHVKTCCLGKNVVCWNYYPTCLALVTLHSIFDSQHCDTQNVFVIYQTLKSVPSTSISFNHFDLWLDCLLRTFEDSWKACTCYPTEITENKKPCRIWQWVASFVHVYYSLFCQAIAQMSSAKGFTQNNLIRNTDILKQNKLKLFHYLDKSIVFIFPRKHALIFHVSKTVCMKYQCQFSGKNKKSTWISKCSLVCWNHYPSYLA